MKRIFNYYIESLPFCYKFNAKELLKKIPGYLLIFGLISSSFNVVPLLVLPIFFGIILLFLFFFIDRNSLLRIKGGYDFRIWFIVYIAFCIFYAKFIGIDVFSFSLYRREFKFIFPFLYLIVFSSFYYSIQMKRKIIYSLLFISGFNLIWLLFGLIDPRYHNLGLYPFEGYMWESISGGPSVYLGPFITHSAAGGFYGTMTLCFLGIYQSSQNSMEKFWFFVAIIINAVCLCLTDSRAFMLSTAVISGFIILYFLIKLRSSNLPISKQLNILSPLLTIIIILIVFYLKDRHGSFSPILNINNGLESSIAKSKKSDARLYDAYLRIYLWKIALEDLEKSPFLGVGPSRYDDDNRVLATIPKRDVENRIFSLPTSTKSKVTYFQLPFIRINIGTFIAHTDQHPHNVYLDVLSEGGLILFSIFIFMYSLMIYSIYCIITSIYTENVGLLKGVLYSFSGVSVASLFGNNLLSVIPMMTIFSIVSFLIGSQDLASRDQKEV